MFETTPNTSSGPKGLRHQYTQSSLITEVNQVARDQNIRPGALLPGALPDLPDLSPKLGRNPDAFGPDEQPKIAIVGAGCSGLFLGLMIDFLHEKIPEFNLKYDIFEAAGEDRVGGRLFTYNFPPGEKPGPHEYYDVGGMRFPENPVMERVFDLFDYLKMPCVKPLTRDTPNGTLIPYSMTNKDKSGDSQNEPFRFNDITRWGSYTNIAAKAEDADPFRFNSDDQDTTVDKIPVEVLKAAPGTLVEFAIRELRDALKHDAEHGGQTGWEKLMEYDRYTTRQWLASDQQHLKKYAESCGVKEHFPLPPFNASTINFLETMNGGTDWYDQAFSETVLESLDFDYGDEWDKCKRSSYNWWCIMGGAQQLPIIMEKRLSSKPRYKSPVVAIRNTPRLGAPYRMEIDVKPTPSSEPETLGYSAVFNTTTLGCLRRIDTTGCRDISTPTKVAMRTLAYGQSCKVGIKFSKAWWKFCLPEERRILSGGLGHSDMHIRTLVYPSYNILAEEDEPAVLLVSYTWQQDAERIGALISRSSPENEEELKLLLLRELARLHATSAEEEASLYEIISCSYLDHYAHNWSTDPNTAGAFAFFRAQQFSTLWPKIITPSGDLVITGEAASPHHAWVVGAIESSVVGLYSWLYSRAFEIPGAIKALRLIDGTDPLPPVAEGGKETKIPFLRLPDYMPKKYAQWLGLVANARREKNE
ncbi:hypothetical protein QBC43DRAFT_344953 [Cladorrhinum sp. PSN259]|nr:hypothetical protein QBC43DRAFT_344953 [Cladorrhinum sp. PSN259]